MAVNPTCFECGEEMHLALKDKAKPLTRTAWGSIRPDDEWRCPNGHHRDVTDAESRWFE